MNAKTDAQLVAIVAAKNRSKRTRDAAHYELVQRGRCQQARCCEYATVEVAFADASSLLCCVVHSRLHKHAERYPLTPREDSPADYRVAFAAQRGAE